MDERLWVVQDANFNVTALLDDSGEVVERYIYDPSGQATVLDAEWNVRSGGSAYDWLYLHQGGRFDTTSGLYHFRFRDYSPTLGRWTSLDPLSYAAGDVNLYRTVGNNPINSLDLSGLFEPGERAFRAAEALRRDQDTTETIANAGLPALINGLTDTVISTLTLGIVDRVEIYPVPPEYRDAYERAYFLVRVSCEVGTVFVPSALPAKAGKAVRHLDVGQSVVLVGRGVFDLPEVTRSGGGPLRLEWSEGMLLHGPTWTNSTDVILGLFGVGSNTILLRRRRGEIPATDKVAATEEAIASIFSAESKSVTVESLVLRCGDGIADWLGPAAIIKRDDLGAFVLLSRDGFRRFRIDWKGKGVPPEHGHLEIWDPIQKDWVDAIPGKHRFPFRRD